MKQESSINDNYLQGENSVKINILVKKPNLMLKLYNYPMHITCSHMILAIKKPTNMYCTVIMYT